MEPDSPRWIAKNTQWPNYHHTIRSHIAGFLFERYPAGGPRFSLENARICAEDIIADVKAARAVGMPCRAIGRAWSLSDCNMVDGALVDLVAHWGMMPLQPEHIDPACPSQWREGLWLIQGGAGISEINRIIERNDNQRTMQTTGAANGQTIVGAFSTGTHGSRFGAGAIHDYVAAIHLILPDGRAVWIERADRPIADPSVAAALGADLIRDTDMFRAVQLSFGSFGVIANVVLQTRERILLETHNMIDGFDHMPLRYDAAMRHVINTLDIDSHPGLRHPKGHKPSFFQPIIDLNHPNGEVPVTLMYEHSWQAGYTPNYALSESGMGPGYDIISCIGPILDTFDVAVPLVARLLGKELFKVDVKERRSWGEVFGYKAVRRKVASSSIAVPIERATDAIDALVALNKRVGPAPLVLGGRYVWKSDALLAMNKWDRTFVISVDGIWNNNATRFFDAMPGAMEQAQIPYTQHWGKHNGYTHSRIKTAFKDNRDKWIAARHALIPDPADRDRFANSYMRLRGLDE